MGASLPDSAISQRSALPFFYLNKTNYKSVEQSLSSSSLLSSATATTKVWIGGDLSHQISRIRICCHLSTQGRDFYVILLPRYERKFLG